jgi:tetratricopeptide (TPR) repeat protein
MKKIQMIIPMMLLFAGLTFGVDTVSFGHTTLYPETEENVEFLNTLLNDAVFTANRLYENDIHVLTYSFPVNEEMESDYRININAVNMPDSSVLMFTMGRVSTGEETEPYTILTEWEESLTSMVSKIIFYLWGSFDDFKRLQLSDPPEYIEEFGTEYISQNSLPFPGMVLLPYSIAVKENGNILLGCNSMCLELDRNLKIRGFPGSDLTEKGNYTYAFNVSASPGGTIFFRPPAGAELYSLYEGSNVTRKIRTGITGSGPFTILRDGSAIVVDAIQKKAIRIEGRKKKELPIFVNEYSYVYTIAAGPEGNLWVFDSFERKINIFNPTGTLIDFILPLLPAEDVGSVKAMTVYNNGDFLLLTQNELHKFERSGRPVWKIDAIPFPEGGGLSQMTGIAVDSNEGLIYMTEYMGKRMIKLYDHDYRGAGRSADDLRDRIMKLNRDFISSNSPAVLREKAMLYESLGAYELAKAQLERTLELDPFDMEAEYALESIETALLEVHALELMNKTIEILDTLGPESARQQYSRTVQLFEQLLQFDPGNTTIQRELQSLKELFFKKEALPAQQPKILELKSVTIENLFPSLMQYYLANPVGSIVIENPFDETVHNLKAELSIKKFMDFPSETERIETLKKGETATIDLYVLFNTAILSLEEDMPVQARIKISYKIADSQEEMTKNQTVMIYKRTALSWDITGKLASFITPNEEIISQFSHRVSDVDDMTSQYRLSEKLLRAARICDALGTYGIHYIEDPESPISSILGSKGSVDTVRFPRTTLYYRSGDCDDTTALLASLLESSAVSTAIMTSPGHVFLAFDTEEPEENGWQFQTEELEVIKHNGTLWIPLETTLLENGFVSSWKYASKLIKRYQDSGELEFIPVRDSQAIYPSIPLPESGLLIVEPTPDAVDVIYSASILAFEKDVYSEAVENLEEIIDGQTGRKKLKTLNQLAILHARFGNDDLARQRLESALSEDSDFVSTYINLANLQLSRGETENALSTLLGAKSIQSDSILVNLMLARTYYAAGNSEESIFYLDQVALSAPKYAERFAYMRLQSENEETMRASNSQESDFFYWDAGD